MTAYCMRCKKATGDVDETVVTTSNGRRMSRCKCDVCGTTKCRFLPSSKSESGSGFSTAYVKGGGGFKTY